jgi:hypothetical protein
MQPGTLFAASYLVDVSRLPEFKERAAVLQRRAEDAVVCTGPWPPYNFVEVEER